MEELPSGVFFWLVPLSHGLILAYKFYLIVLEHLFPSDVLYFFVNIYFLKFVFLYPNEIMLHAFYPWRVILEALPPDVFGWVLEAHSYLGEQFNSNFLFYFVRLVEWVKISAAFIWRNFDGFDSLFIFLGTVSWSCNFVSILKFNSFLIFVSNSALMTLMVHAFSFMWSFLVVIFCFWMLMCKYIKSFLQCFW